MAASGRKDGARGLLAGQDAGPMAHRSGQNVTGSTSAQVPADGTREIMRDKITNVILAKRGPEALLAS